MPSFSPMSFLITLIPLIDHKHETGINLKGRGGHRNPPGIRRSNAHWALAQIRDNEFIYGLNLWVTQVVSDCSKVYNKSTSELLSKRRWVWNASSSEPHALGALAPLWKHGRLSAWSVTPSSPLRGRWCAEQREDSEPRWHSGKEMSDH